MAFTCSLALPVRPAFIYSAQHITAQPPESFAQNRNNNNNNNINNNNNHHHRPSPNQLKLPISHYA